MTSIQIREAEIADSAPVSALMGELGYDFSPKDIEHRIEVYRNCSGTVLVAEDCGEVLGFVSLHVIPLFHASGSLGRITAMCIHSNCQRKGIGRALLARLEEIALSCGCARIEVTSGDHREEDAHLFYQACGYAIDSRRFQKVIGDEKA
jgi:GNAT superfamily N-acetyltransferase